MKRPLVFIALLLWCACAGAGSRPASLEPGQHDCDYCRRSITETAFASQVVAPAEAPLFFDDLQCLRAYLSSVAAPPVEAVIFVADHNTRRWIRADAAVFSRVMTLSTPMGSHLVAHESVASRDADPLAVRPAPVEPAELIPAQWR